MVRVSPPNAGGVVAEDAFGGGTGPDEAHEAFTTALGWADRLRQTED